MDDQFYLARIFQEGIASQVNIPADLLEALHNDAQYENGTADPNSLGEFDYFWGSGWMCTQNGHFIGYSISDLLLKDGDEFKFRFTLNLGKDIGGYSSAAGQEGGNYDKIW